MVAALTRLRLRSHVMQLEMAFSRIHLEHLHACLRPNASLKISTEKNETGSLGSAWMHLLTGKLAERMKTMIGTRHLAPTRRDVTTSNDANLSQMYQSIKINPLKLDWFM
jgi:hypothetical protein